MEPYGNMVKKKLIDKGMRQKELAEMVGCSKIYMSYICLLYTSPSPRD